MKFYQVPIGQHFELDGKVYVKTSPLIASLESDGSSTLIKRAVSVRLLSGELANQPNERAPDALEPGQLINRYHQECMVLLEKYSSFLDDAQFAQLQDSFEQLRERFLHTYTE